MPEPIEKSSAKVSTPAAGNRISSPTSTGGAGTFFEQHVAAYWLAQLLVRGVLPVLIDSSMVAVHFQIEHLGWHTDDFLVVGESAAATSRKLAGQVKRTLTISALDEECKKTFWDFWRDFQSPALFSPLTDRLVLVTQRGTNLLLEHFGALLDCARAAYGASDFEHRLETAGFISKKSVDQCEQVCTIVGELQGRAVSPGEIWPFLRILYVLSLDLDTGTRQTEAAIKTLLANTTTDPDRIGAATNSWNTLLSVASSGMASARQFRRDNLPESLQQRHAADLSDHSLLAALKDHTSIVLSGIKSTVGAGPHIKRDALVQQIISKLGQSQVVLLSGPAGTGKSALAKDAVQVLSSDYFVFGFRAEEFAQPHFDATLHNSQIPGRAVTLRAVLASQDRKILLVESIERLLEKSTRDAFTDLLTLAAHDPTLRIILTCRDYSADLVRSCFLGSGAIDHSVLQVPAFTDPELLEVQSVHSTLSVPLANRVLRQVLRNPYFLDKSLRINWSAARSVPENERDLRALFWDEVVRAEHYAADGMPFRREAVFTEVALQRARALSLYVSCATFDPAVISSLLKDSLLTVSAQDNQLIAPAHDVLEDWAILRWIDGQYTKLGGSFRELSETIGPHPAVRRAYRKWISERIDYDPASTDRLFRAAVADVSVPAIFRDDTLVSLLRARSSPAFLERNKLDLLANDGELLKRVIHLLRIACVTTPAWLHGAVSLFSVPEGPAWPAVLHLLHTNFDKFRDKSSLLLLGLIEDWGRSVSAWAPYPDGADSAAKIAFSLLPCFDSYGSDERKRLLRVIAKIPKADRTSFERLVEGGKCIGRRRNRLSEELEEIVFAGVEGMPVARDMPTLVTSVLHDTLLCSESDIPDDRYGPSLELDVIFGLKEGADMHYSPASALRTPMYPLLQHHPRIALDCLITIFNHSAEWYAHPRIQDLVEPPFEVELRFSDGQRQTQWCNARLWNWYRGTSVGPDVLQSFLMALERWLLNLAKEKPASLDSVLLDIMRRSDSGALTAVVASVATAFPFQSGETLLTILRSPILFSLDRQRLVCESQAPSNLYGLMPMARAENRLYEEERKGSDSLPHRKRHLETAVADLQLSGLADRVHEILDEHRKAIRPVAEQDDEDRVWRLTMHRMDLRQYSATHETGDVIPGSQGDGEQKYVRLELNDPEPDVKKMVDVNAPRFELFHAHLRLLMWAIRVFRGEDEEHFDPADWRSRLKQAQASQLTSATEGLKEMCAQGGPGIVAAVCVRDHWKDMTAEEQNWCVDLICSEVVASANTWDRTARAQRFDMSADRPCARVLSSLLGKKFPEPLRPRVRHAFITALTHSIDEVRWYATLGVADQLWPIDRDLSLRCVNAIAEEANIVSQAEEVEKVKKYDLRRDYEEIIADAADTVRTEFWENTSFAANGYDRLNFENWYGAEAHARILAILASVPSEPLAVDAFTRAAQALVGWWRTKYERQNHRHRHSYQTESALSQLIQKFVMQVPFSVARMVLQPILDAVESCSREIYWFVLGLLSVEDREPNTQHFWAVWQLFANRLAHAKWIACLDETHSTGTELVSALFLGTHWKENVRHWRSLEGNAHHLHSLFESLPPSAAVLHAYVRFLYDIGEQSLPEAFIRISNRLKTGNLRQMLATSDTVFMLEVLLQRYVYAKPLELKSRRELKDAVLFILDELIDNGSSASFRMRDDFVTPISLG